MNTNWNYPTSVRVGAGRRNELADVCSALNMKRPLIVTDPGLAKLSMVEDLQSLVNDAGLAVGLFSEIKPNPTGENVEAGVQAYLSGKHDGVIALGGGSGLDAGKAIALMAHQSVSIWDLEDVDDNWLRADADKIPPIIALPTTAGTGSEVGRASVIVDQAAMAKKIIFHPKMVPESVILDAELTVGLPPHLTAATGMDALSHSLEAYCSPQYHPMAEGIALEGMRLVKNWLPKAVRDGGNIEARQHMLVASTMGATAFQRGLGGMHALAHPLGALYDAHHGTLNAVLMPYVLRANADAIGNIGVRLARYLDLPNYSLDGLIDWVLQLRKDLDIPHTLAEIGINDERADDIGVMAHQDPSAGTNPIELKAEQYSDILSRAVNGNL